VQLMTTFHLRALEQTRASAQWKRSMIGAMDCWVSAKIGEDARALVTRATIIAARSQVGDASPIQPWMHDCMASCAPDETRVVPEGFVLTTDGSLLAIED